MGINMTGQRHPAPPVERAAWTQARAILQVLLIVAAVASGLWMLHRLASVVLVLIVAALFAYVIAPLVHLAGRPIRVAGRPRRLSRGAAIAVVYVLMAGGVSVGAALLLPSATEQVNEMIAAGPDLCAVDPHVGARLVQILRAPADPARAAGKHRPDRCSPRARPPSSRRADRSLALVGALTYLPWLLLIPILAFFLLKDAASFRRTIVTALPHRDQVARPPVVRGTERDAGRLYSRAASGVRAGRHPVRDRLRRARNSVLGAARRPGGRPGIHPARRAASAGDRRGDSSARFMPRCWRFWASGSSGCSGWSKTT